MQIVKKIGELKRNADTIDKYLLTKKEPEYDFAIGLISRGICFIAIEKEDKYHYYPSRFMGYVDNSMDNHLNNENKDGRDTNPAISSILNNKPIANTELENHYITFCNSLGFIASKSGAFGVKRKYWILNL